MVYAIVETGGHQIRMEEGKFYNINNLQGVEKNIQVLLNRILLFSDENTKIIGTPIIPGAVVKGRIVEMLQTKKILVYKMRPKKKTRRKQGHRQKMVRFFVESIEIKK